MPLGRTDVVTALATRTDLTREQVDSVLGALQEVLVAALEDGDTVRITGLLSVERTDRPARTGRNPRTGEPLDIPAGHGVRISAGSALKNAVKK